MKKEHRKQLISYLIGDYCSANIAWLLLNIFRYNYIASSVSFTSLSSYLLSENLLIGQILVPLFWMMLYYFSGYYNTPMRKSRLFEFNKTLCTIQVGILIVFFFVVIDDLPRDYHVYYQLILVLFLGQFVLTYSIRALITQRLTKKIHNRILGFNTLIIGAGEKARKLVSELDNQEQSLGHKIVGFIAIHTESIEQNKPVWQWEDIDTIIKEKEVEEFIVVPESNNENDLFEPLNRLYRYNLPIRAIADKGNILSQSVKMDAIFTSPMIEITHDNLSEGRKNIKSALDRMCALLAIILLAPLLVWLAWKTKKSSSGEVLYKQERIGKNGKPFTMLKFRTMKVDAEQGTPQLSSENDNRITEWGKVMRKYRLDELPQLWNVLKGDMSLVGPRPERAYYIEQIVKKSPSYYLLLSVKPGITSWGMVKYGYANTVDKMIERLQFDLIYLNNHSLSIDLKILIYTIRTILTGKGM